MATKKQKLNKHEIPILDPVVPTQAAASTASPAEEQRVPMFASEADKDAFFNEYGKQPYYRNLIRATGKLPVTFEEAKPIAEKGRVHLRALAGRFDDGVENTCALGAACQNPRFKFVPRASFVVDWSDPVNPKRAILKIRQKDGERATPLKVTDDKGSRIYHLLDSGHITAFEDGKIVVLPDNEAEIVREAAEPVYLVSGNYYADEDKLEVVGPVCHLDMKRAIELAEKEGARKPRFTSKAVAEDTIARAKAKQDRMTARREESRARTDAALESRFVKKGLSEGRPGSRKMERMPRRDFPRASRHDDR